MVTDERTARYMDAYGALVAYNNITNLLPALKSDARKELLEEMRAKFSLLKK